MDPGKISVEKKDLFVPHLDEVAKVLEDGLKKNFAEASAKVTDCPDLTQKPFTLASQGICGTPRLVDLGGVPNLIPQVKREKLYDLKNIASLIELPEGLLIGAGAGPWPHVGVNCELMANLEVRQAGCKNETYVASVDTKNENRCKLQQLPDTETRCALMGNLLGTEGKPGQVLEVRCKKRIGEENFVSCMRKALESYYKDQAVGIGGTFLVSSGKAKLHIMPDFSTTPLTSEEDVNNWLKFYNMSAPLVAVGTFISADPGLDLRVEHFHCFSHHGEGGHYHYDTEAEAAEYVGYFVVAESIYRLDRPTETHSIGRN